MDRKEEILQTFSDINYAYNNCTKYDTLKRMLDELTEPCEDAISRILERMWNCRGKHTTSIDKVKMEQIIRENLPFVTPQKMGRWLSVEDEDMNTVGYYCSECDLPLETEERTPFCPYCGVKMEESED